MKANPNIGKTVTYETYQLDVDRAEKAPAARNDILAKRFGLPMEGYTYYFTYEETLPHPHRSFWQMPCALGGDLSQGDDFCSFAFLFPLRNNRFGVKTRNYISSRTLNKLPAAMRIKYEQFMREGSLIVLEGTVLDMMQVYEDLDEHIVKCGYDVRCFGYDPYNAKEFVERWASENGPYGIEKVIQGAKTESVPLGELKKLAEDRLLIFDEELMTYAMGNCITMEDTKVTISHVGQTSGTAVITVKVAADTNHTAPADGKINVTASFREYLYGFDINLSDTNPATRVSYPSDVENAGFTAAKMNFGGAFSYGSWPSTPGEKFMPRPCMLLYNGTVGYYLNHNDLTKKADGSGSDIANMNYGGNGMMEWSKIYIKRWESGGVYHFRCSDVKVDDDYECWSNYDKNNKEIPHFYTPIFDGSQDSSGRMRSISGQTCKVSTTAQQEIDAAKLNGADSWYTEVAADILLVQDLLVMMFKSTDLQTTAGMGNVSTSAAVATGTMNTKGMFWGSNDKSSGVKVFGMENPWGNVWRRTAGWMYKSGAQLLKITRGTKDGSTAADYNITGDGYMSVPSSTISANGYISGMKTMPYGRLPITASGSSTTNEADYVYRGTSAGPYYAIVGGRWSSDLNAGPFVVSLTNTPTAAGTSIGAALSCKPLAAA